MSRTERNLQALREKRRQLEGSPDDVQRLTEVLFPRDGSSVPPLQKFAQDEGFLYSEKMASANDNMMMTMSDSGVGEMTVGDDDREASALITHSLMNVMRKAKQLEDAPLTTAAMKELHQLERERIYTRVLVRVRFPDTVSLQGYFHPRHTLLDVHQWVVEALAPEFRDTCTIAALQQQKPPLSQQTRGIKTARKGPDSLASFFELYTSPPRRVLAPDGSSSLYDLNFTPAVVINLAWLVEIDSVVSSSSSESLSAGFYLTPQLLRDATDRNNGSSTVAFPVGQDLTKKPTVGNGPGTNSKHSSSSAATADPSEKPSSTAKVPKWFKIGR